MPEMASAIADIGGSLARIPPHFTIVSDYLWNACEDAVAGNREQLIEDLTTALAEMQDGLKNLTQDGAGPLVAVASQTGWPVDGDDDMKSARKLIAFWQTGLQSLLTAAKKVDVVKAAGPELAELAMADPQEVARQADLLAFALATGPQTEDGDRARLRLIALSEALEDWQDFTGRRDQYLGLSALYSVVKDVPDEAHFVALAAAEVLNLPVVSPGSTQTIAQRAAMAGVISTPAPAPTRIRRKVPRARYAVRPRFR